MARGRGKRADAKPAGHRAHKLLSIAPVTDLRIETRAAFASADNYFDRIKKLVRQPNLLSDQEVADLLSCIRGFFWEMVATFDTMLCWAVKQYELPIPEGDISWEQIRQHHGKAKKSQDEWGRGYKALEKIKNSDWYFEVHRYRNFAHRAHLTVDAIYEESGDKVDIKGTFLVPARDGQMPCKDIVEHLRGYLKEMGGAGTKVFELCKKGK